MPKPIVVGLDIGTTSAISIHDLKKNLLYLKSRRHMSASSIIKQITIFGSPLIIATDKKEVPYKIRKIAAAFDAKIFSPDHDLTIEEKDAAVNISMRDSHERDALASSLFAFKSYSSHFATIDMNLKMQGKEHCSDRVKELLVRKDAKNIAEAIEMACPKEKKDIPQRPPAGAAEPAEEDRRLKDAKESYAILREYAEKLEERIRCLEIQKQEYQEEQMRKNEDARKAVLREREVKNRDIIIRQLRFQLGKEKEMKRAYEEKAAIEDELKSITDANLIPVIVVERLTKEDVLDSHRKHSLAGKAVWIRNFNPSKVAAKVLSSIGPKLVFTNPDEDVREILSSAGIIVVDNIKPEMRSCYAAVSPEIVEKEIKGLEKKSFVRWLEDYRKR